MAENQFYEILMAAWKAGRRRLAGELFSLPFYRAIVFRTPNTSPPIADIPRFIKANPNRGAEIAHGRFYLAGETLSFTDLRDPWVKPAPSRRFVTLLHEFGWIHDLRAFASPDTNMLIGTHIDHWIGIYGAWNPFSWAPGLTAQRCLNWLCIGRALLNDEGNAPLRRACLIEQICYLDRFANIAIHAQDRMKIALALIATGVLIPGAERFLPRGLDLLNTELSEQVLQDGGHVTRSPEAAATTLCDLVAFKFLLEQHNMTIPEDLKRSLARMAPMVRFLCAADGHLVVFNGGGEATGLTTQTVLQKLNIPESAFSYAPHSGYQRVKSPASVLFMDTGRPPPRKFSAAAHAGALAFELSTPQGRLIVNCGWSENQPDQWRLAVRSSAAHSTLVLNNTSSAQICTKGLKHSLMGPSLRQRGLANAARRSQKPGEGTTLEASHGGYLHLFGLIHQRQIRVSKPGTEIFGEDRVFRPFDAPKVKVAPQLDCTLRFHLHPHVRASLVSGGHQVLLVLPDGTGWQFTSGTGKIELQPSVYLAHSAPPQRTVQLMIPYILNTQADASDPQNHIHWSLQKIADQHKGFAFP